MLRTERDFRQIVVDYAAEAASHGAVYLEGIFTPAEAVRRGAGWDEVFTGFCDGAQEARERHDVQVRLTPDIPRGYPMDMAELTARHAVAYPTAASSGSGSAGSRPSSRPSPTPRCSRWPATAACPPSRTPGRPPGPNRSAAR